MSRILSLGVLAFLFLLPGGAGDAYAGGKILVVISSADQLPLSRPVGQSLSTGYFLVELAEMLQTFGDELGYSFDFATPDGRQPTLDLNGLDLNFYQRGELYPLFQLTPLGRWIHGEASAKRARELATAWRYLGAQKLSRPLPGSNREAARFAGEIERVQVTRRMPTGAFIDVKEALRRTRHREYTAVFFPGGHAPMVDFYQNGELGDLLTEFRASHRHIIAICHAPIVFRSAHFTIDARSGRTVPRGSFPFAGTRITTVSGLEENSVLRFGYPKLPGGTRLLYFVNEALERAGLNVRYNLTPGYPRVERDGFVLTGNGPQAMHRLVQEMRLRLGHGR